MTFFDIVGISVPCRCCFVSDILLALISGGEPLEKKQGTLPFGFSAVTPPAILAMRKSYQLLSTVIYVREVGALITKVLVAIDGSHCSERALDFALDLAEKYTASLLVMNVLQMPVYGSPDDPMSVSAGTVSLTKDLRKVHEDLLAKAVEKATSAKPNLKVTTALREGNPPTQIVNTAAEGGYEVVVLGHSGQGRFREFFLGSTSERVAHLARCVVIIVK